MRQQPPSSNFSREARCCRFWEVDTGADDGYAVDCQHRRVLARHPLRVGDATLAAVLWRELVMASDQPDGHAYQLVIRGAEWVKLLVLDTGFCTAIELH